MKTQTILTAAFACLSALLTYVNHLRGKVDLISFAVAKLSYAAFPTNFPRNDSVDPDKWRARVKAVSIPLVSKPGVSVVDVLHDGVVKDEFRLIRLYNSGSASDENPRDVLVYYFGGGFVVGSVEENDGLCKTMAAETNFIVVAIEYSLAPEYPYPRGFNDSLAGLRWVKENIAQYGGNPERIFVSGESAGGNLAAAVTARNLDTRYVPVEDRVSVIGTLLIYPGTSGNFSLESYIKYSTYNGILTTSTVKHVLGLYKGGVAYNHEEEYTLLPLYTPSHILAQFPPTTFVVAEYDVLRDDSLHMIERMKKANAPVHMTLHHDIHGFFGRDLFPNSHAAVKNACRILKNIAQTGKFKADLK
jgi:acetyl esterase